MRKRRKLLLTLGCAALAVVLLFALTRKHEPTAHGKPLSYWVEIYSGPAPGNVTQQDMAQAEPAIKDIGTNAIPFLLEWIDYELPKWKFKLSMQTGKLPNWIIKSRPVTWFFAAPKRPFGWSAAMAFKALGPTAAPAIHQLEIRAQGNSKERRGQALYALSHIGPAAVPAIARILSNPDRIADTWVRPSVVELGTNALPLVPMLLQYLDQTNAQAVGASARILGHLRLEADLVIPALIRKLDDPRGTVSNQVASALANFGPPALSQLTNALSDPDPLVRQNATNAIARITARRPSPARTSPFE